MQKYNQLSRDELLKAQKGLTTEYDSIKSEGLALDMSRGKPADDQLKLSEGLLSILQDYRAIMADDGTNCANYGALSGIPEAKRLMADVMGTRAEDIFVGGNSSLNLMHDCMSFAYIHGFPNSSKPWKDSAVKFICPSPGYDRHFAISEHFGFELLTVDMTPEGPNVEQIKALVKDPAVKGMWSVPKYSNPTGVTYSDAVVRALADLEPAAEDFKFFWDNSYAVHHLDNNDPDVLLDLMAELRERGKEDMALMFTSTSKITFPGSGISAVATSEENLKWITRHMSLQTISYDKLNQLRTARFLPNHSAVADHMAGHAEKLRPKFAIVSEKLSEIDPLEISWWERPKGGYFICLQTLEGCAKRVVALCKEAGVILTPAGATHPYGKDPNDNTIRIAPTFPPIDELEKATDLLCLCVKLASVEKYLG